MLIASAATVYSWEPNIPWLMNISYVVYFVTFFFTLSLSFIKPKDLGNLLVSNEVKRTFLISEMTELGFNYRGYASLWKHSIHENKNHLFFKLESGEKFDYEIVLQNKEMKEELKLFLKNIKKESNIRIDQTGHYSF